MDLNKRSSRRNFLSQALGTWFFVSCLPLAYGIFEYVLPPKIRERLMEEVRVGSVTEIPANAAKLVEFKKRPAVLIHTEQGQYKAFSAVCTHLSCTVQYGPEDQKFHCNCHGSIFDLNGKNIAGPARSPLQPLRVVIKGGDLFISEV